MTKILLAALLGAAAFSASAANVGVGISVNVGDPNYYGSIDIGNYPPPQLVYPTPVIVQPAVGIAVGPLYLHVPIEHSRNWRRYCAIYHACGRPVYFVHDSWYRQVYAPRYINEHRVPHEERRVDERRHEENRLHEHEHREGEGR
jgi:hypothetical protein